jgi:hypothetical protein
MFWGRFPHPKLFRTLRFRLAGTFLVLLAFVLMLVAIAGTTNMTHVLENQSNQTLLDELGALKGYIHFEGHKPYWFLDPSDPEEAGIRARLSDVFVIADEDGSLDSFSSFDRSLVQLGDRKTILAELAQIRKTQEPVFKTILSADKIPYQIISSTLRDDTGAHWYVAEGRSLVDDNNVRRRFRRNLLIFSPLGADRVYGG